jgi:putative colanic acid biosynthesis UDP-glucose lipid carrier transferase
VLVFALWRPGPGRLHLRLREAATDLLAHWAVVAGVLLAAGALTDSLGLFEPWLLATWAVLTPAVGVAVLGLAQVLHRRWAEHPARRRRAIVVGAGPLAARLSQALRQRPSSTELVAYFDDRLDDRLDPGAARQRLGSLADVAEFVHRQRIDEVYVALPLDGSASGRAISEGQRRTIANKPNDPQTPSLQPGDVRAHRKGGAPRVGALLQALQGTTASVFHVPDILGLTIVQGRLRDVGGVPVIGLCESPFTGVNAALKRAEDLVLASLILLAIAPLLVAVAVGVKLSSPGPVIFRQRRNGLDGREIVVWKFRSMRVMDDGAVVRQATRDDPRVTPFGAFIRRTSLDELPQFFNVLQGRMSIVGPRPHAVAHNETYRRLIGPYMVRHKVKPGITGWAQIHGHRGETDTLEKMRDRVAHDLEYLRHWSLGLDLRIVLRTALLMLADRQAY